MRWGAPAFAALFLVGSGCFDFSSISGGAPSDGGVTDGTTPGDETGSDASSSRGGDDDGGTASGDFCASQPAPPTGATTLCDDFDDYETSTLTAWDQAIQANGSVGLTSIGPFSTPNSMTTQTNVASMGEYTEADVLKAFSKYEAKGVAITISFEMNIVQWDTGPKGQSIAFEVIFKNSPLQFNQVALNLNSLGVGGVSAQIAENSTTEDGGLGPYNSYPFTSPPVTNAWTKIEMTLSVPNPTGTQSNTVTVKMGGVIQIDGQALQVPVQGGVPYIHLGIGYVATPAAAWVVRYDNFVANITSF